MKEDELRGGREADDPRTRDLDDVQAMLIRHPNKLDMGYLEKKVAELDLTEVLREQIKQARE